MIYRKRCCDVPLRRNETEGHTNPAGNGLPPPGGGGKTPAQQRGLGSRVEVFATRDGDLHARALAVLTDGDRKLDARFAAFRQRARRIFGLDALDDARWNNRGGLGQRCRWTGLLSRCGPRTQHAHAQRSTHSSPAAAGQTAVAAGAPSAGTRRRSREVSSNHGGPTEMRIEGGARSGALDARNATHSGVGRGRDATHAGAESEVDVPVRARA